MIIGRLTGQFGKNRIRYYSEYQHRCEGTPLTLDGSGCHNRGADWIGLGNRHGDHCANVAGSDVDRGTRLFRRAVLHQPGHVDDAVEQQAAVGGRLSGIPLPADLRFPAAGRHHQSDLR